MPLSALRYVDVDHTASLDRMGALLVSLAGEEPKPATPPPAQLGHENGLMLSKGDFMERVPGRWDEACNEARRLVLFSCV